MKPLLEWKSDTEKQEFIFLPNRIKYFLDTKDFYTNEDGEKVYYDIKDYGFMLKSQITQYNIQQKEDDDYLVRICAGYSYITLGPMPQSGAVKLLNKIDKWINNEI